MAISAAHGPVDGGSGRVEVPHGAAKARVIGRSFYGHDQLVRLELASGQRLRSRSHGSSPWRQGDEVHVWVAGPVSVLAAASSPR